jgi:hypothetical protein
MTPAPGEVGIAWMYLDVFGWAWKKCLNMGYNPEIATKILEHIGTMMTNSWMEWGIQF